MSCANAVSLDVDNSLFNVLLGDTSLTNMTARQSLKMQPLTKSEMKTIRVVLAEDHPVVREGIRTLLERALDLVVVAEASDGQEALRLVEEMAPDVLLLDMEMPGLTGVEVARRLQAARSPVRILALSSHDDDQYIFGLLEAGAAGYLLKEEAPEAIVAAVRGVARGEVGWLSRSVAQKVMRRMEGRAEETCPLTERSVACNHNVSF